MGRESKLTEWLVQAGADMTVSHTLPGRTLISVSTATNTGFIVASVDEGHGLGEVTPPLGAGESVGAGAGFCGDFRAFCFRFLGVMAK